MLDKEILINAGTVPVDKKPLTFASDSDIDAVLSEMDEEKQPFERPEIKEDVNLFEIDEPEVSPAQKRRSNQTAQFFVETIDRVVASGFATWAKSDSSKEFEAEPEDIDELTQYWGVYFADKNIDLPPWVMALVVTMLVLNKKLQHATHVRKLNIELEQERKEKKTLREENERLKREKETEDLRRENEKLKGGKNHEPGS